MTPSKLGTDSPTVARMVETLLGWLTPDSFEGFEDEQADSPEQEKIAEVAGAGMSSSPHPAAPEAPVDTGAIASAGNVVFLRDALRVPRRVVRVPQGKVLHLCFNGPRPGTQGASRDRLSAWVERIRVGGRLLTPRGLRWVHRVLTPVMQVGGATSEDARVGTLQTIGSDLSGRRFCFGDNAGMLQRWVALRVPAVWAFEGRAGKPPSWLAPLCECIAHEALRPEDVCRLASPTQFYPWEIWAKIRKEADKRG